MFDFSRFAVGGARRPDTFTGLSPQFSSSLAAMFQAAPPEIQQSLRVMSGYRSPERQATLWQNALKKYGSAAAARKWVAPPGRSNHNHGQAVDLKYLDPAALKWAHANAGQYGLAFPLSNENWHIEPAGARGGHPHSAPAPVAGPADAPMTVAAMFNDSATPAAEGAAAPTPAAPWTPGSFVPNVAAPNPMSLASMFMQQQAAQSQQIAAQKQQEADAEQQRRTALLSQVGSMFG